MAKKKKKRSVQKPSSGSAQKSSTGFVLPAVISKHPNSWCALLILALLLILFNQAMFQGKMFLGHDTLKATKCYQPFINDALDRGIYPLWNPYIFSGMPSFASLSSVPRINIIDTVINHTLNFLTGNEFTRIIFNYLLFGWLLFFLLRRKKLSIEAALFAGVTVIFMPQFVAFGVHGHNSKLLTLALIPLIIYLIDQLLLRRNLLYLSLTALVLGFQLHRAQVQVVAYTYMLIGFYFLFITIDEYVQNKKIVNVLKSGGLLAAAILLAIAISSVLYISVYEYSHYSTRGGGPAGGMAYNEATGWSFSPIEMMTFIIPGFVGFGGETYWGPMGYTDYPLYMGILPLFLLGIAFILKRDKMTWFFLGIALFSLIVSFGKNFPLLYGPMYKFLPFFNKFRVPSMIHILLDISVIIVAAIGLNALFKLREHSDQKGYAQKVKAVTTYFYIFGGIGLLIFFYLLLGESAYFKLALYPRHIMQKALELARGDGFKMIIILALGGGAVIAFLKNKFSSFALIATLLSLTIIDLWWVDFKIIDDKYRKNAKDLTVQPPEQYFAETPVVKFLQKQKENGHFRIINADQRNRNLYMYHRIENVYGYNPAKLRIYQEAIESLQFHENMLTMLNTRYIVSGDKINKATNEFLPRAFFVRKDTVFLAEEGIESAKQVYQAHRDQIFNFIKSTEFNPKNIAILEDEPPFAIEACENNRVQIVAYDIHEMELKAEVEKPAHLILSEIYYPVGWKAYIDGEETEIYKTNYILRSIFLKPGKHTIRFVFAPAGFTIGLWISLVTFISLAIIAAFILIKEKMREN